MLEYYYEITDDVTSVSASRFAAYAVDGPRRAGLALDDFGYIGSRGSLLDVGCGSGGGVLVAKERFGSVVGLDIALRWLIIAQKRFEEAGDDATLVCADMETPPFADRQFSHVLALDVIEHAYDVEPAIAAMSRQLRSGGRLWLSASNKHWLGPHPATGIWAAAFRSSKQRSVSNGTATYDPLRFLAWVTPAKLRKACENAGLEVTDVRPSRILGKSAKGLKALLMDGYATARQHKLTGAMLTRWGPFFQMMAQAP